MSMAAFPAQTESVNKSTYDGAHLYLTLDEDDQNLVLELVRSDEVGMYIRDNGTWVRIDPNADNPRVWDRVIVDVTDRAVDVYDIAESSNSPITATQFRKYELPEGDLK